MQAVVICPGAKLAVGAIKTAQLIYSLVRGTHSKYESTEDSKPEEEDLTQGPFRKLYYSNGLSFSLDELSPLLDEEVTEVQRCCCSLTGWFPSGVLTAASWTLTGTTVRHEYVIIKTTK